MENPVYLNGKIVPYGQARVGVEDRGYQFADGIYEVVLIYNGTLFALKDHLKRLKDSAQAVDIKIPGGSEALKREIQEYVGQVGLDVGTLYIQITRGEAPRTHAYQEGMEPCVVMLAREYEPPSPEHFTEGVKAITTPDDRWSKCYIKTIALLPNILAKKKAKRAGVYQAIYVRDDFVTEGTSCNVFAVFGSTVTTPPASNYILNGITRQQVLKLAKKEGLEVVERSFTRDELYAADEAFLTGTTTEVMPVIEVDGRGIGAGHPGRYTRTLLSSFRGFLQQETS